MYPETLYNYIKISYTDLSSVKWLVLKLCDSVSIQYQLELYISKPKYKQGSSVQYTVEWLMLNNLSKELLVLAKIWHLFIQNAYRNLDIVKTIGFEVSVSNILNTIGKCRIPRLLQIGLIQHLRGLRTRDRKTTHELLFRSMAYMQGKEDSLPRPPSTLQWKVLVEGSPVSILYINF